MDYRADGQPTGVTLPNGMYTGYAYDARGRMTQIAHKTASAGSVLESYTYTMDKAGLIDEIDQADGSYWTYDYDTRYRLTSAVRHNSGGTIQANYAYTYDDGDNLVTKVEPWVDDFTDGTINDDGWTLAGDAWTVSSGAAVSTPTTTHAEMRVSTTDPDVEISYTYTLNDTSSNSYGVVVDARYASGTSRTQVRFRPHMLDIIENVGGVWSTLASTTSVTSAQGQAYKVRLVAEGTSLKVYRQPAGGGVETLALSATMATTGQASIRFYGLVNGNYTVDDVRILASNLSRTTTLGVNTANELTSMADYNGTTSYSYDELGRMISKSRGGSAATYSWHLDDRLMQVNSNFPGEGVVDYNYGGDGNRRTRTYNSATTTYNWAGFAVASEENSGGSLTRTYVGRSLAHIDGATPSSGTYSYYTHDHLLSTRGLYDGSKNLTAAFEYSSYGDPYLFANASATTRLFTGHDFDATTGMYFAPFRYYGTGMGRWMSEDPLGMIDGPNIYEYVLSDPVGSSDLLGLMSSLNGCGRNPSACAAAADGMNGTGARGAASRGARAVRNTVGRAARSPAGQAGAGGAGMGALGQGINGCGPGSIARGAGLGLGLGLGGGALAGPNAGPFLLGAIGAGTGGLGSLISGGSVGIGTLLGFGGGFGGSLLMGIGATAGSALVDAGGPGDPCL